MIMSLSVSTTASAAGVVFCIRLPDGVPFEFQDPVAVGEGNGAEADKDDETDVYVALAFKAPFRSRVAVARGLLLRDRSRDEGPSLSSSEDELLSCSAARRDALCAAARRDGFALESASVVFIRRGSNGKSWVGSLAMRVASGSGGKAQDARSKRGGDCCKSMNYARRSRRGRYEGGGGGHWLRRRRVQPACHAEPRHAQVTVPSPASPSSSTCSPWPSTWLCRRWRGRRVAACTCVPTSPSGMTRTGCGTSCCRRRGRAMSRWWF